MRKILAVFLVVGLLLGVYCIHESSETSSVGEEIGFDGDYPDTVSDPVSCGGGEGGGGGGGQPG